MNDTTATKLLQLNAAFYQTFAGQFSDTRQRLQPGVRRFLDSIDPNANILDLGCGNGELARELARREHHGSYLGLDFSAELLDVARRGVVDHKNFSFIQGNLGDLDWVSQTTSHKLQAAGDASEANDQKTGFNLILAFATLHHLPGSETRRQVLHTVRNLLTFQGCFIHSNWQFLKSERLRKRLHPWKEIGLTEADVDPGDYLLDWRRGGFGLRYVHHFSEAELESLAEETGFRVVETFNSDGETGDLGLYQVWEIAG
jgi:tRNA (uracil-5-)-methyltransferase TRM9